MRVLAKLFYFTSSLLFLVLFYFSYKEVGKTQKELHASKFIEIEKDLETIIEKLNSGSSVNHTYTIEPSLKYILQWTNPNNVPFVYMGVGQKGFLERKCRYTNCYVTNNRTLLGDTSKFDVIAFAGTEVRRYLKRGEIPKKRSPHQKYTFTNIESAANYPICDYSRELYSFFNWTWTYRLDSDARWGYIIVRDSDNKVIGPRTEMHWKRLEDMDPVGDELRKRLRSKTKAATWFVSNCVSDSRRELYVESLQKELAAHQLQIDIVGNCGSLRCSRDDEEACFRLIKENYYFYLSFENSFSEDYVTEKLTNALKNEAIPIVYGGANYTRFMPDGIYLNAKEMTPNELAKKMKFLIDNPEEYEQYFRWKNHYTYHRRNENVETDDYCGFCELLNNEKLVKDTSVYTDFKLWWNGPSGCDT